MNPPLIEAFLDAGLIQYGLFEGVPFRLNLHLLPSYPDVLKQTVDAFEQHIDFSKYERLLCANSALPLGIAISLKANIPLVYSLGSSLAPVHDLVGAYDVGHPTLLIINVWDGSDEAQNLIDASQGVGLNVIDAASIFHYQKVAGQGVDHTSLLDLSVVTSTLVGQHRIPAPQAEAVQRWIESTVASG